MKSRPLNRADGPAARWPQGEMSSTRLIIWAALYFTTVLNASFWRYLAEHLAPVTVGAVLFALSLPAALFSAFVLVFSLLVWPGLVKPLLIGLLLLSSAANYAMWQFGLFIDADMVRNILETNPREAADFFTRQSLAWVALTGLVPALALAAVRLRYHPPLREARRRLVLAMAALAALTLIAASTYKEYVSFGRNHRLVRRLINPGNYLYAAVRHFQIEAEKRRPFAALDPAAVLEPIPDNEFTVFVLVLGETARARNFALYGYSRDTTPRLSDMDDLLTFSRVDSCGTSTAISLPCLFSELSRGDFDAAEAKFKENLIDLLQNSGYQVWWRDNDDGCKEVCRRVPTEYMDRQGGLFCEGRSCLDEALLVGLEERLSRLSGDTVIVLHARGSHGPSYYQRYPENFRVFTPTCDTTDLQTCSREAIVNTYDNTIVYTDHLVASAIEILKKFPQFESGLLYVSDHGESLGENNIYLHGLPYAIAPEEQKRIPLLLWLSKVMLRNDWLDRSCLARRAAEEAFSHDHFFHSLLSLLEVRSRFYDPGLDIFRPCRLQPWPLEAAGPPGASDVAALPAWAAFWK